jgi:hypothetical protein
VKATLIALVAVTSARPVDARPARPAPSLPPPTGTVINVNTESQLQGAMRALSSDTTIVLAPGTYRLTRSLYLNRAVRNVAIRGASNNPDDVVIIGRGMANANYGDVPYGIWTGGGVDGILIANLTIRDCYFHDIIFNARTQSPHVYNVRLVDSGQQFIKSNPDGNGVGASNGIVEYSVFEFTTTARDDYPKGVDSQGGSNWIIRHNLFRNLVAPRGQLMGPAVLIWRKSTNATAEGNTFINCARGIYFGGEDAYPATSHRGGVIRNNFFYRSSTQPGDVGIHLADSPGTQVVNNTVLLSGTYGAPIEYRFTGTSGVLIANNLTDGMIRQRDGATGTVTNNLTTATSPMFRNLSAGDLHLVASATRAIDHGISVASVSDDWDGERRPQGAAVDIGADEFTATTAHAMSPQIVDGNSVSPLSGVRIPLSGRRKRRLGPKIQAPSGDST